MSDITVTVTRKARKKGLERLGIWLCRALNILSFISILSSGISFISKPQAGNGALLMTRAGVYAEKEGAAIWLTLSDTQAMVTQQRRAFQLQLVGCPAGPSNAWTHGQEPAVLSKPVTSQPLRLRDHELRDVSTFEREGKQGSEVAAGACAVGGPQ